MDIGHGMVARSPVPAVHLLVWVPSPTPRPRSSVHPIEGVKKYLKKDGWLGVISEKKEVLRKKHVLSALDPPLPPYKRTVLWKPPDGFEKKMEYLEIYWVVQWLLLRLFSYLWLLMIATKQRNHFIPHHSGNIFWMILRLNVLVVWSLPHLLKWTHIK